MNEKLEHIVIKYLNKMYGDLKEYRTDEYPNRLFFIRGKKVYMELEDDTLTLDYDTILKDLINFFSLEYDEMSPYISKWVKETYNLREIDVIPWIVNIQPFCGEVVITFLSNEHVSLD
jgi:hypothetical protein